MCYSVIMEYDWGCTGLQSVLVSALRTALQNATGMTTLHSFATSITSSIDSSVRVASMVVLELIACANRSSKALETLDPTSGMTLLALLFMLNKMV